MIDRMRDDDGDPCASVAKTRRAGLAGLPQPYHLFAALTGGLHFHLGDFIDPAASLFEAQALLGRRMIEPLPAAPARVLDLGCGMGGTTALLAAAGYSVLGLDPCAAAIEFGRALLPDDPDLRLATGTLRDLPAISAQPFDALVCVEVLQHLPALDAFLDVASRHVRPGALLVVADVFTTRSLSVPYHASGALGDATARAGLECVSCEQIGHRTTPTLGRLLHELVHREHELHDLFGGNRPDLASEIDELVLQCQLLRAAFHERALVYELSVHAWPTAS